MAEEHFECGCSANVEWVEYKGQPYLYYRMPHIVDGERVCPIHKQPLKKELGESGKTGSIDTINTFLMQFLDRQRRDSMEKTVKLLVEYEVKSDTDRLVELLRRISSYAFHRPGCLVLNKAISRADECTCGFNKLAQEIVEVLKQADDKTNVGWAEPEIGDAAVWHLSGGENE